MYRRGNRLCPNLYKIPEQNSVYTQIVDDYYKQIKTPSEQRGIAPVWGKRKEITRIWPFYIGLLIGFFNAVFGFSEVWNNFSLESIGWFIVKVAIAPLIGFSLSVGVGALYGFVAKV